MFKKKTLILLLVFTLIFSNTAAVFADKSLDRPKSMKENNFAYTMKEYESILPFKLTSEETVEATKHFNMINKSFDNGDYKQAEASLEAFYKIMSTHWISLNTLSVLLPYEDMMKFGGQILTEDQKEELDTLFKQLKLLRKEKKFEAYFALIRQIHERYYEKVATALGDTNKELQLLQYIKGADQLTSNDLLNYSFDDYLEILPFDINDKDYHSGKIIFKDIIKALKQNNEDKSKSLMAELNNLIAPYWISDKTFKTIVPHERYTKEDIPYFSREDQITLNKLYDSIEDARLAKDYDLYFSTINRYFQTYGHSIQGFYADYFDEIVFIRS